MSDTQTADADPQVPIAGQVSVTNQMMAARVAADRAEVEALALAIEAELNGITIPVRAPSWWSRLLDALDIINSSNVYRHHAPVVYVRPTVVRLCGRVRVQWGDQTPSSFERGGWVDVYRHPVRCTPLPTIEELMAKEGRKVIAESIAAHTFRVLYPGCSCR